MSETSAADQRIRCVNEKEALASVRLDVQLRILMPTLNRPEEVSANALQLLRNLKKIAPSQRIEVVMSENCSDSDLRIGFEGLSRQLSDPVMDTAHSVLFVRRSDRLSLGEHVRWLHEFLPAPWIMWLGDDDLLSPTYLALVARIVGDERSDGIAACVPGYGGIDTSEFFALAASDERIMPSARTERCYPGPGAVLRFSGRGNQLSGLVFCTAYLTGVGETLSRTNLYPWMCWLSGVAQKGVIIEMPGRHSRVTGDKPKLFTYGSDGLYPDIVEAIFCGCGANRSLAVRAARHVLWYGVFRIGMTGSTANQRLLNYLRLWFNPRMDRRVFVKVLPKILFLYARRNL